MKKELVQTNYQSDVGLLLGQLQTEQNGTAEKIAPNEMINIIDRILKCPVPYPNGFFNIKTIPCSCVNISTDPTYLSKREEGQLIENHDNVLNVLLGYQAKLILSGEVDEQFIRSAS